MADLLPWHIFVNEFLGYTFQTDSPVLTGRRIGQANRKQSAERTIVIFEGALHEAPTAKK